MLLEFPEYDRSIVLDALGGIHDQRTGDALRCETADEFRKRFGISPSRRKRAMAGA